MTILAIADVVLVLTAIVWATLAGRFRQQRDDARTRGDEAIADRDGWREEIRGLKAALAQCSAELDETRGEAYKAAAASMGIVAMERRDFAEMLAQVYADRPAIGGPAPEPPELLASGHALVEGDPAVLIQLDDE